MNSMILLVGYARSGMTVLNRCLSSDDRLICLSEINTRYFCPTPIPTPREQLHAWYGKEIKRGTILEEIDEARKLALAEQKTLLLRDWSFGSFVPLKYNNLSPTNTLNTIDDLKRMANLKIFCLVRNPIDVWLSMKNSTKTFHDRQLNYLLNFTKDVLARNLPIIKYEDFCDNPLGEINQIYAEVNLNSIGKILLSNNITGDIDSSSSSRGISEHRVIHLSRRDFLEEDRKYLLSQTRTLEILELLKYPANELC